MPSKTELEKQLHAANSRIRELEEELALLRSGLPAQRITAGENREIRQERDRLLAIIEHCPASVVLTDTEGTILYVNPHFETITGYSADEAIGNNPRILKTDSTPRQVYEDLWKTITSGKTWKGDLLNRRKNGALYWEHASIAPIFGPDGTITHYAAVKLDITGRKQVELDLMRTSALLKETGRIANIGGWEYDCDTNQLYTTEEIRHIHEVRSDYLPTLDVAINFFVGESRQQIADAIAAAIEYGTPWDQEFELETARGNRKWVRSIGVAETHRGRTIKLHGTLQDITATRELKRERRRLVWELEERIRQLDCLHKVSAEAHRAKSDEQFLGAIVDIIPTAWNEEERTCVRITLGDRTHASKPFRPAGKGVSHVIQAGDGSQGRMEVFRRADRGYRAPEAFDKEEQELLESLAAMTELCLNNLHVRESLRQSMKRYSHIMNSSRSVIFEVDAEGVVHFANRYAEEVFGFSLEEMIGRKLSSTILPRIDTHGHELEKEINKLLKAPAEAHKTPQENEVRTKSGRPLWFSWHNQPIYDAEGNLKTMVSVGVDATKRRHAELQSARRELVESTFSELGRALLVSDSIDSLSELVLEAAKRITGCRHGFVGALDEQTGSLLAHTMTRDVWEECAVQDKSHVFDQYAGLWGWVLEHSAPVMTNAPQKDPRSGGVPEGHIPISNFLSVPAMAGDRLVGLIAIANSDTGFDEDDLAVAKRLATFFSVALQRREYEKRIEKARRQSEEANRAKSAFLAKVSHEIRTPMNSILGMTDVLLRSRLAPAQRDYLGSVRDSANALLAIINDILDLSRIENNKLQLMPRPFSPARLVRRVVESMASQARQAGLTLKLHLTEDMPACLEGDAGRLRQVLVNILGNALKFTREGQVDVSVETSEVLQGSEKQCVLHFRVEDTGTGIPEPVLDSIFESFTQADDSLTRVHGGLGLGLAIAKEIIQHMNGILHVESVLGSGSVFTFDVPFIVCESPGDEEEQDLQAHSAGTLIEPSQQLSILLADDNEDNIRVIKAFLDRIGHTLTVARNGREAIEALRNAHHDAVLMDVEMPVMNGFDATRLIRKGDAGPETSTVCIIAMTAHAQSGYKEMCKEAGMDDYLAKPVTIHELSAALERAASRLPVNTEETGTLDTRSVLEHLGGDASLLNDLYSIFIRTAPQRLQEIEQSIEDRKQGDAVRSAHSLKGNAATIGATALEQRIARLHEQLKTRQWEAARDMLPGVRASTLFVRGMLTDLLKDTSSKQDSE